MGECNNAERIRNLGELFFQLDDREQRVVRNLYRRLALGQPVTLDALSSASGVSPVELDEIIQRWPGVFRNDDRAIVGFWGLTPEPVSQHLFTVRGRALYAWCAWDTLFIPIALNDTATVRSRCQQTGDPIELIVGPDGIESFNPASIHLSFLLPTDGFDKDVMTSFCHYVHFFRDREAAEAWLAPQADCFVLSLGEALEAARHGMRQAFGEELHRYSAASSLRRSTGL